MKLLRAPAAPLLLPARIPARRRIAYADPPYIGQAKRHYSDDPRCAEVDHAALLRQLELYDAWALSCSSTSLKQILSLPECPDDVRIGAWVKPFCSYKPNVNPAYAWEPVIFRNCRIHDRWDDKVRDWISENISIQSGVHGAKPERFCFWLFEMLGMQPGDEFADLYPGTGGVTRAWQIWQANKLNTFENVPLFAAPPSGPEPPVQMRLGT